MTDAYTPAEPGQIRENHWQRWYIGIGEREFVVRCDVMAGTSPPQLLTLPAHVFTAGMAGAPVGHWTGSLLDPEVLFDGERQ